MAPSDERAAIRFFVFSTSGEREARRAQRKSIRSFYGVEQRRAVETGLEMFADFLCKKRLMVESRTVGVVSSRILETPQAAFEFIVDSLGDD